MKLVVAIYKPMFEKEEKMCGASDTFLRIFPIFVRIDR